MGAIGGLLGLGGGDSGTDYSIQNPTSIGQTNTAYQNVQNSLANQQALLDAINNQGGLSNQTDVYNQLQGVASGMGPNPAQAQYNRNVDQISAQQAGLIGSQKGISPALQARLIAQQGGDAKQNAAGAAAVNQAQQQMSALGGMGNIANTQVANQLGLTNAMSGAALQSQGNLLGAQGGFNNASAGLTGQQMQGQQAMIGGLMQGASSAASMAAMSDKSAKKNISGGDPQKFLDALKAHSYNYKEPEKYGAGKQLGVMAQDVEKGAPQMVLDTPQGKMIDFSKAGGPMLASLANLNERLENLEGGPVAMSGGGSVPSGGPMSAFGRHLSMKGGGFVPGQAKVAGDSPKNDVVDAKLSPGEIVIPRSVVNSKNPKEAAARFVEAVLVKKGKK